MEELRRAHDGGFKPGIAALAATIPYCRFLGVSADVADGEVIATLPYSSHLIGNPALPALHGGAVAGFLEATAILQIAYDVAGPGLPKPVDITTDYLRSGRPATTFAKAIVKKLGRRVVNVHAEAWQADPTKPIAALRGHFLLPVAE